MHRGRVGGQMYRVLIFALIIPMIIIGAVSVSILLGQMKDRYEEQLRAENTRIKSIVFDITSIVYTSLEPIISSQEYRDLFASDSYAVVTKGKYDALDAAVSSIISRRSLCRCTAIARCSSAWRTTRTSWAPSFG